MGRSIRRPVEKLTTRDYLGERDAELREVLREIIEFEVWELGAEESAELRRTCATLGLNDRYAGRYT